MSRPYCSSCQRPQVSCICHLIYPTKNNVHVVILQHPSEVKQTKGTVKLLSNSLSSCQVFIGEDFTYHKGLLENLIKYKNKIALLYPSTDAEIVKGNIEGKFIDNIQCIILLDGTWKKAYRLYMMNKVLQDMPHCILPDGIDGEYHIRKTQIKGALSTLEACCHGLAIIEGDSDKYEGLLKQFKKFNQMQLAFLPNNIKK
ncbi:MAG: DTW domain-containing protein [Colwelliaceae bacterium]|nr:DTW domain-containing protein [Colwelliaceae bacterium]